MMQNQMELTFTACPQNEAFARVAIAAFAVQLNPTLPEMADIKTAVSEAVTNAIVHGYRGREDEGLVRLHAEYGERRLLTVSVSDEGCGIEDVEAAMQPFYSTGDGAERSGMGFCVMQTFMDAVDVESTVGHGTTVTMRKYITGEVGLHRERVLDEIG
ncbi:MAG: anti-sigma F factor [Clostridia bacterium]